MNQRMPFLGKLALVLSLLAAGCLGVAETAMAHSPSRSGTTEKVTLQYRVAGDAFAPSRFVAVVGDGISLGLTLEWDLPAPGNQDEKVGQDKRKEQFYGLIEMLEAKAINGVEFECNGEVKGGVLRAKSIPYLTDAGRGEIEAVERRERTVGHRERQPTDLLDDALTAYVDGLRTGDVKTLNKLFLNEGQFCFNGRAGISCSSFAKALPSWVAKPDPKARGAIRSREIIGRSMARVTYELDFNGTSYVDYLLLYRKGDRWVVVAKTTFFEQ